MLFNKKGQSTAEYAIVIGLVVAVAAGVLQVALKSGIRQKNTEAMGHLLNAGNEDGLADETPDAVNLFSSSHRYSEIDSGDFVDTKVTRKGGSHYAENVSTVTTETTEIERIEGIDAN